MLLKTSVDLNGLTKDIQKILPLVDELSRQLLGREAIITSALDGKHSTNSLHYSGNAIDLRTRDLPILLKHHYWQLLRDRLGDDFDVVKEATHVHVEFDPD